MIAETVRRCMALLLVAGPVKQAVGQNPAAPPEHKIPHFSRVRDGLWRGGRPTARDVRTLARQGVKTIVNLQGRDYMRGLRPWIELYQPGERAESIREERALAESLGLSWFNVPFNSLQPVSDEDSSRIIEAIEIISDPKNQPVFIHCEHGRDRTGLIIALERVLKENWTPKDAYGEWAVFGHMKWLNQKFTGNLDHYFVDVMQATGRLKHGEGVLLKSMVTLAAPKKPKTDSAP